MPLLICLAIALHDVDGPIYCASGERVRLNGIGATEMDGTCRPNQPCVPGDPFIQRRVMARAIGAIIAREDVGAGGQPTLEGRLWFAQPIRLSCEGTGHSYSRLTAWCKTQAGRDVSCLAIGAGVAVRWERFDRGGR